MLIIGKNSVLELLKSDTAVEKILVQNGKEKSLYQILQFAKEKNLKIQFVPVKLLDNLSEKANHQGVIAYTSTFVYTDFHVFLQKDTKNRFLILCDGIQDVHNLGSIIRVAECAGATGVIIPKNNSAQINETVMRVSAGATNHLSIARVQGVNYAIEKLKKNGYWIFGLEADGESLYKVDLSGDIVLVIGGEDKGLHMLTRKKCDKIISIPLKGKMASLNASVALGIAAYEKVRQSE